MAFGKLIRRSTAYRGYSNRLATQLRRRRSPRLAIEALENRSMLSTLTVDRLTDFGQGNGLAGDLRYCILNALPGDTISFGVIGTSRSLEPFPWRI